MSTEEHLIHALSGAGGGVISMALTYPLITIGTRLQVTRRSSKHVEEVTFWQTLQAILKQEGIPGLYSGLGSALFGISLTNGVYYYFYELSKDRYSQVLAPQRALNAAENLLIAALAGTVTVMVTNPIWLINTRMATGKGNTSLSVDELNREPPMKLKTFQVMQQIIRQDGVLALWQGVGPALVLVSNPAIQYMLFEQMKKLYTSQVSQFDYFVMGAISKLVATCVTYPYIVMKSRMQLKHTQQRTMIAYLVHIIKSEGPRALYRGLGSKLTQSVLTAAILFAVKEQLFVLTSETVQFLRAMFIASIVRQSQ